MYVIAFDLSILLFALFVAHDDGQDVYHNGGYPLMVNGTNRHLLPCIPLIAVDGKEARRVTCTKDSPKTEMPCWLCQVKKGKLGDPVKELRLIRYRDSQEAKRLVRP